MVGSEWRQFGIYQEVSESKHESSLATWHTNFSYKLLWNLVLNNRVIPLNDSFGGRVFRGDSDYNKWVLNLVLLIMNRFELVFLPQLDTVFMH